MYGTQGIGKSSWAASAPAPIFLPTEDGAEDIGVDRFPVARSYFEVIENLGALYEGPCEYRTICLDTADWLERLIWTDICAVKGVSAISEIGYGKGYDLALNYFRDVLAGLDALREKYGATVVVLAHSKIERFENPSTDAYDRYMPRLYKSAAAYLQEWADEVFFASYRIYTAEGADKRIRAAGGTERVIYTTERPSHLAKNRLGLPDELPFLWSAYAEHAKGLTLPAGQ